MLDDFSAAILQSLRGEASPTGSTGMSVLRLGKVLDRSASGVMRQLTLMGDVCGMGWVHVQPLNDRFMVALTDAGRELLKSQPQPGKK